MASFHSGLITGANPLGVTPLSTGTAPETNAGPTLAMNDVTVGTLSALVYGQAKVNLMTLEPQWQVSADASTWYDAKTANNAASVVMTTGTGAAVPATVVVSAPDAVYGWAYARCSVVSRLADAVDGDDEYNVSYNYLKRGYAL
jgi:hypothetical protein